VRDPKRKHRDAATAADRECDEPADEFADAVVGDGPVDHQTGDHRDRGGEELTEREEEPAGDRVFRGPEDHAPGELLRRGAVVEGDRRCRELAFGGLEQQWPADTEEVAAQGVVGEGVLRCGGVGVGVGRVGAGGERCGHGH
jgi:hypothetical protein